METRVVRAEDLDAIATILSIDVELCQQRLKFYNSLGVPPAEFMELEDLKPSYDFFFRTLNKWLSKHGNAATFTMIVSKLKESFLAASEKISHLSLGGSVPEIGYSNNTIWFEVPEDVRNFTGRVAELQWIHDSIIKCKGSKQMTVITTLSGLGGIGKTSLTIKYAWKYRAFFQNNIIWINAENDDSLNGSFTRLTKYLNIVSPQSVELDELAKSVYKSLRGMDSLMIFDNVESEDNIENILPTITHPDEKIPTILITSRNRAWSDCALCCDVDVFNENDSLDFLKSYLTLDSDLELELASSLSDILQRLPIAVRQAAAYVKQLCEKRNISNVKSIRQYIQEFEKCSKSVLNFDYCKKTKDKFQRTTFMTWNVTLKKIQTNWLALKIMKIISFLTPDDIPIKLFLNVPSDDADSENIVQECEVESAIDLLVQHSMIAIDKGKISVHRIVQAVVRDQLETQGLKTKLADEALSLFESCRRKMKCYCRHHIKTHPHYDYISSHLMTNILKYSSLSDIYNAAEKGDEKSRQSDYIGAFNFYKLGLSEESEPLIKQEACFSYKLEYILKLRWRIGKILTKLGKNEEATKYFKRVFSYADHFSLQCFVSMVAENEADVRQVLKRRSQILQIQNEDSPFLSRTMKFSSDENEEQHSYAQLEEILEILTFLTGMVEPNLLETIYSSSVIDSALSTLLKCHIITTTNGQISTCLVVKYWYQLFTPHDAKIKALRNCLLICQGSNQAFIPTISVWKRVLEEYEELVPGFPDVGVKACQYTCAACFDLELITFHGFIYGRGHLMLAMDLLDSFIHTTSIQTKLLAYIKFNYNTAFLDKSLDTAMDIVIEENLVENRDKEKLLETALQFYKMIINHGLSTVLAERVMHRKFIPEIKILLPLLLLGKIDDAIAVVTELRQYCTLCQDLMASAKIMHQIAYYLILGTSNNVDRINISVIRSALEISTAGYQVCYKIENNLNDISELSAKCMALVLICVLILRQKNTDSRSIGLENVSAMLGSQSYSEEYFHHMKAELCSFKSRGYSDVLQESLDFVDTKLPLFNTN